DTTRFEPAVHRRPRPRVAKRAPRAGRRENPAGSSVEHAAPAGRCRTPRQIRSGTGRNLPGRNKRGLRRGGAGGRVMNVVRVARGRRDGALLWRTTDGG